MFWYKWANQMDNKWWKKVIVCDIDQTAWVVSKCLKIGKATNLEHRAEGWQLMNISMFQTSNQCASTLQQTYDVEKPPFVDYPRESMGFPDLFVC